MTNKRNISLIVGLSIPVLMILFVAGSIYLPGIFIKPKYNFVYVSGYDYYHGRQYSVSNNILVKNQITYPDTYKPGVEPKLFLHDVRANQSNEISFEDAQKFDLDPSPVSKDGFEVVYGSRGEGVFPLFFFSDKDYNSRFIKGHNISNKLNVQLVGNYYNNFQFMGWVNK